MTTLAKPCTCGHIACVCGIIAAHPDPTCKFRRSAACPVEIECDHGYGVCPICDPCTCPKPTTGAYECQPIPA